MQMCVEQHCSSSHQEAQHTALTQRLTTSSRPISCQGVYSIGVYKCVCVCMCVCVCVSLLLPVYLGVLSSVGESGVMNLLDL